MLAIQTRTIRVSIRQKLAYDVSVTPILTTLNKPNKSVTFSPKVAEVHPVLHASEMTDEEKSATYYTWQDLKRIEEENQAVVERMYQTNTYIDTDTMYFRGLEVFLTMAMRKRRIRVNFVVSNVLREQQRNGKIDQDWIQTFTKNYYARQSSENSRINGCWDHIRAA